MTTDGEQRGVFGSFRRVGDAALGTLQTRLELLALELAEEKRWFFGALVWTTAAIFFSGLALLTITATVVALCPPKARPLVLLGFSLVYTVAAVIAILKARAHAKDREMPFSSTIGELRKDLEGLRSLE